MAAKQEFESRFAKHKDELEWLFMELYHNLPHTEVTFLVSGSQLGLWTFRTRSHSVLNQMPVNDETEEGDAM